MKNMQNEPNFKNAQISVSDVNRKDYEKNKAFARRQNEPNLCKTNPISAKRPQFAVFQQFPLIYVLFFLIITNFYTNSPPIYALSTLHSDKNSNFHHFGHRKFIPKLAPKVANEPNLYQSLHPSWKTNPIYTQPVRHSFPALHSSPPSGLGEGGSEGGFASDMLSWPAVRNLPTYSGKRLCNTGCASSRLPANPLGVLRTTAYVLPTTNKKMQNEPNLQNTQIIVTSVNTKDYENNQHFRCKQNEPNSNPIQTKINLKFRSFFKILDFAKQKLSFEKRNSRKPYTAKIIQVIFVSSVLNTKKTCCFGNIPISFCF